VTGVSAQACTQDTSENARETPVEATSPSPATTGSGPGGRRSALYRDRPVRTITFS
jgi:hypothetical protein